MTVNECFTLGVIVVVFLCPADGVLTDITPYKNLVTLIHNFFRTHEGAADMKMMQWDDQLQVRAAEWSEGCYWGHQNMGYGENLAYFYTSSGNMSSIDVIINSCQSWWNETFEWKWSTDCGVACHYTQMIWASTDKIGCALSHCPTLKTDATSIINAMFFVCFYNPPGNYVGSYPYTKGKNCEQCGMNSKCSAGLCVSTQ